MSYEQRISNRDFGVCADCTQPKTRLNWCKNCNSRLFEKNFNNWTSGNVLIDNFIKNTQLRARSHSETIEWIPFDQLRNIQYLTSGGFSNIYKAIWLAGEVEKWDNENQQWMRYSFPLKHKDYEDAKKENVKSPLNENEKSGRHVILKSNDCSNIEKFLNEWENYLDFVHSVRNNNFDSVNVFGITQDPKTFNYIIVMDHLEFGNLRSNLMIKKYNPNDKYRNLYDIANSLSALHKCDLIHCDFHSGLSRSTNKPTKSNEVYGVLPYIAPEVLRGQPYTKASDIYSFGIIMWEMTSGIPAFNNVPHDLHLSLRICLGLRPEIIRGTDVEYAKLMKRCWSSDPNERPTAKELFKYFENWRKTYKFNNNRIPVPEKEFIIRDHPLSYKKIDYSEKLNEILQELSSRIIYNKKDNKINETILSEALDCIVTTSSEIDSVQEFRGHEIVF